MSEISIASRQLEHALIEARTARALGELVTHHRTALRVLTESGAETGDVYVDAQGHRWRVTRHKIGRCLEGVGFDCRIPPLLLQSVILVGLRFAAGAGEIGDEPTTTQEETVTP
jgi:hypothetical protein